MPTTATATAEAMAQRLERLIAQWGQPVTLTHGGESFTPIVRVTTLSSSVRYVWFRESETTNWAAPAYTVTLPGDYQTGNGGPAVGDTVTLYGQDYAIRKIDRPRVGAVIIKTVLFTARDSSP